MCSHGENVSFMESFTGTGMTHAKAHTCQCVGMGSTSRGEPAGRGLWVGTPCLKAVNFTCKPISCRAGAEGGRSSLWFQIPHFKEEKSRARYSR